MDAHSSLSDNPPVPPLIASQQLLQDFTPVEKTSRSIRNPIPVRVALVDSGVNYLLPEINVRLARHEDGSLVAYDFWDLDDRPFDFHPTHSGRIIRHGTQTASLLLKEAPFVELVPYRYPRADMARMSELVKHASDNDVRVIGLPLGGNKLDQWLAFDLAARRHPEILFIVSAGNNGRDIDSEPVYPAALTLDNMLVVTSADDFVQVAEGVNWGRSSVDYLVPAERQLVTLFDGSKGRVSGSSYAVPRVVALAARIIQTDPGKSAADVIAAIRSEFANGILPRQIAQGYISDPQRDANQPIRIIDSVAWSFDATAGVPLFPQSAKVVPTLGVPLDVLVLDELWTSSQVGSVLAEAQQILHACALLFVDVQIRRVSAPEYLRDLETGASRTLMDAVRLSGQKRRATVVFARDTRMSVPFDAEAFGKGNTRTRSWLTDTVWLTLALRDRGIALAHELFHVLANSGAHSQLQGNLMLSRTTGDNRQLNSEQCLDMRTRAVSSGLARSEQDTSLR